MSHPAIRLLLTASKNAKVDTSKAGGSLLEICCRVKPGVKRSKAGITSVTENYIELCVPERPRDGEANRAIVELIASVRSSPRQLLAAFMGHPDQNRS
jgi:uncharacterized protein YggU (UPF0235/DUF167 family)